MEMWGITFKNIVVTSNKKKWSFVYVSVLKLYSIDSMPMLKIDIYFIVFTNSLLWNKML